MNFINIPVITKYLTLQEIKELFADCQQESGFSSQIVGNSIQNRPIELMKYINPANKQNSKQHENLRPRVLLYGGEDATEPVFSQTIKLIIEALKNLDSEIHSFNCDWYFIDCINPDGYLLNEKWYCQPGNLAAFFEYSWEDEHSQMIFMNADRPELKALHQAFKLSKPDFIFNMHDESHFPADGYKLAFSEPMEMKKLSSHFRRVSKSMDLSEDELIIMDSYGREKCFSTYPAFIQNPETFIFLNEACGYKRIKKTDESEILDKRHPVSVHLQFYQKILENHDNELLDSARFHVKVLLRSIENSDEFNAKMLCLTGYGLEYLIKEGIEEASQIKKIFLNYILNKYEDSYAPIEVEKQVFTQLDALFSFLKWKTGES